jgi:hypothetical protein
MTTQPPVRPIRTEADLTAALAEFELYFDNEPTPGTAEGDRFELLGRMIFAYADEVERLSEMERSSPAGAPQTRGGVLAALRRSPLVGADLEVTRETTPGRNVDL